MRGPLTSLEKREHNDEKLYIAFAKFEEGNREYERTRKSKIFSGYIELELRPAVRV